MNASHCYIIHIWPVFYQLWDVNAQVPKQTNCKFVNPLKKCINLTSVGNNSLIDNGKVAKIKEINSFWYMTEAD